MSDYATCVTQVLLTAWGVVSGRTRCDGGRVGRHSRRLSRLRINAREIVTELRPRPSDAMFAPAWPLPRQRPLGVDVRDMRVDLARP